MALKSRLKGTPSTGSRLRPSLRSKTSSKLDLDTVSGLKERATQIGVGREAEAIAPERKRVSFLQRLSRGLGAFNPAEAVLTGIEEQSVFKGAGKYLTGIATGIGSAITGRDFGGERRYGTEIAEELGVENKIAKFGLGLTFDIFADPTTYLGGAIVRNLFKGVKAVSATGRAIATRAIPDTVANLDVAANALQDAIFPLFKRGHKATGEIIEETTEVIGKKVGLGGKIAKKEVKNMITKPKLNVIQKVFPGTVRAFDEAAAGISGRLEKIAERVYKTFGKGLTPSQGKEVATTLAALRVSEEAMRALGVSAEVARTVIKDSVGLFTGTKAQMALRATEERLVKGVQRGDFKSFKEFADAVKKAGLGVTDKTRELFSKIKSGVPLTEELSFVQRKIVRQAAVKGLRFFDKKALKSSGEKFLAHGARVSQDPVVQRAILEWYSKFEKLAKYAGIADDSVYAAYYPFLSKKVSTRFIAAMKNIGLEKGSAGWDKEFRALMKPENLNLDIADVFFTRARQIVTEVENRSLVANLVKTIGKTTDEFVDTVQANKNGFFEVHFPGQTETIGFLPKWDAKFINESLNPQYIFANTIAKATGFDVVTSLFKRAVTGLFLPFHVRNYASGIMQNFEVFGIDALNPKNIALGHRIAMNITKKLSKKAAREQVILGGKPYRMGDLVEYFKKRFHDSSQYDVDFNSYTGKESPFTIAAPIFSGGRFKETIRTAGLGQESVHFRAGRAVGQYIEYQQKTTAMIIGLKQGKPLEEALKLAERAGFDYRKLTAFESNIMRRIIPFYSFTRKNIELQLRTLGTHPERINQILASIRDFGAFGEGTTPEEIEALPDYIKEQLYVRMGDDPTGAAQFITGFGTPIEQFANLFRGGSAPTLHERIEGFMLGQISSTNPILKVPIEISIGKDSFRQKDIKDVYDAREYKLMPQPIKDILGLHEVEKDVLERNSKGDLVKTGTRTQYVADPYRLLIARSLFTSRGVSYLDQTFGGDMVGLAKFFKLLTGVRPSRVDVNVSLSIKEKQIVNELQDLLSREADGVTFKKFYQPKR